MSSSKPIDASEPVQASTLKLGDSELVIISYPTAGEKIPEDMPPVRRAVLMACLDGLTNAEIAARRQVSKRTIDNHLRAAFEQLGVRSRTELTRKLIDA